MSHLFFKKNRIKKPPCGTRLRTDGHWSVPDAGSFLFNENGGITYFDSARGLRASVNGTVTAAENGALISGAGNFLSIPYDPSLHIGIGSTIFAVIEAKSLPPTNPAGIFVSNINGASYKGVNFIYTATGYIEVMLGAAATGIGANYRRSTTATNNSLAAGKKFSVAAIVTSFTTANTLLVDGKVCTTTTSGAGATFAAGTDASNIGRFCNNSGVYNPADTIFDVLYIYNRPLSVAQVQGLHANPYLPCEPETFVIPLAAGGTTSITVASATHLHAANVLGIVQGHYLSCTNATQAQTATIAELYQQHVLGISDATHSHSADSVSITQSHAIALSDANHSHSASAFDLTQGHFLNPSNAAHAHTAGVVAITEITAGVLSVLSSLHGQTASTVDLIQNHVISVVSAQHAQTVSALTITEASEIINIAVSNANHALTSTIENLIQQHVISVQNATHAQTASSLSINIGGVVADYINTTIESVTSKYTFGNATAKYTFNSATPKRTIHNA